MARTHRREPLRGDVASHTATTGARPGPRWGAGPGGGAASRATAGAVSEPHRCETLRGGGSPGSGAASGATIARPRPGRYTRSSSGANPRATKENAITECSDAIFFPRRISRQRSGRCSHTTACMAPA